MIAVNSDRVRSNTSDEINQQIDRHTEQSIARHARADLSAVNDRLAELDREWDVERYLETMAPTISLVGLCLGVTNNRRWLLLPAVVQSFFLLHALQGWCPPLPLLRRLGIRTADEINRERYGLRTIRGDLDIAPTGPISSATP